MPAWSILNQPLHWPVFCKTLTLYIKNYILCAENTQGCFQQYLNVHWEYKDHTCFFHALIFARSQGSCLNTRPLGWVFKHCPRDPASVNAMKQTCVIVILAYLPDFNLNRTETNICNRHSCIFQPEPHRKRRWNIKISPFLHRVSLNKMASAS